jgi:hypothetical protein
MLTMCEMNFVDAVNPGLGIVKKPQPGGISFFMNVVAKGGDDSAILLTLLLNFLKEVFPF